MGWLVLVVCLLLAAVLAGRLLLTANPADLARWLRWVGVGLLAAAAAFLLFTGRLAWGLPLALAAVGLLRRWALPHLGPGTFGGRGGAGSGAGGGQTSEVTTDYLRMTLEHASGLMRGTVLKGPFTGRDLAALDRDELLQLLADCHRDDPPAAQLLESYLERAYGEDWRGDAAASPPPPPGGRMSREEALDVLGLKAGATAEEVRAAYRALMQKLHPDQGGSTYLAAKINQAKDTLLGG